MRRAALTLLLAALPLGFAPAPLPRRDREPAAPKRQRELAECRRLLDELGVKWEVVAGPRGGFLRYSVEVRTPGGGSERSGVLPVRGGDLAGTLLRLVREARDFAREVRESSR